MDHLPLHWEKPHTEVKWLKQNSWGIVQKQTAQMHSKIELDETLQGTSSFLLS